MSDAQKQLYDRLLNLLLIAAVSGGVSGATISGLTPATAADVDKVAVVVGKNADRVADVEKDQSKTKTDVAVNQTEISQLQKDQQKMDRILERMAEDVRNVLIRLGGTPAETP